MLTQERSFKSTVNRLGVALIIMIGVISVMSCVDAIVIAFLDYLQVNQLITYKTSIALGAVVDTLSYLSYFLLPAWLFYVVSKKHPTEPIKFKVKLSKYLPLMIFSGLAVTQVAAIFNGWFDTLIGYELPIDTYSQYMTNPEIVAMYMTVSLAPAFAEEVMFRGVVYGNLRKYGKVFAVIASAVAFALMHQNIGQFFYTMVAGVVMALIYEATGSIWGGVFLHMFNNLYAVLQSAILYRYSETTATVILTLFQAVIILVGAISTVCLLCIQKREMQIQQVTGKKQGVFRTSMDTSSTEALTEDLPMKKTFKHSISSPSMIVYVVLSLSTTVLLYFGILLINLLEGFM